MGKGRESVKVNCFKCHGTRWVELKCPQCSGRGDIGKDKYGNDIPCSQCRMSGTVEDTCGTCGGTGTVMITI